ncbi:hypothetical protein ABK040_003155 [Willaertia magna]
MKKSLVNFVKSKQPVALLLTTQQRCFRTNSFLLVSNLKDYVNKATSEFSTGVNQFRLRLPNGEVAVLDYKTKNNINKVQEFYHIEVPPSFKGRGVAEAFAKKCFDHAKTHGWKIQPTCPYIKDVFLKNHKGEYSDIVVNN